MKKSEKCKQIGQKMQENKEKCEVRVCRKYLKSYQQYVIRRMKLERRLTETPLFTIHDPLVITQVMFTIDY